MQLSVISQTALSQWALYFALSSACLSVVCCQSLKPKSQRRGLEIQQQKIESRPQMDLCADSKTILENLTNNSKFTSQGKKSKKSQKCKINVKNLIQSQ